MIRLNYNNMMSCVVGEHGITEEELDSYVSIAKDAHSVVESKRGSDMQEWMSLPYNQEQIVSAINATAKRVRENCEYFVVLGIGGSALGPITMFTALKHLYYNELPRSKRKGPRFYVVDNVDPERMNALFDVIELDKTVFNVITKSGSTSETMSQYLIVMDLLTSKFGAEASKHVIATTSRSTGNLIKLSKQHNFETFFIPDGVGGRFSTLSPVGLLPAAVLGIDIEKLLEGARYIDEKCKSDDLYSNPALVCAVLQHISVKQGKNVVVMIPYADSLKFLSDWYCQLWAESLGKEVDLDGNIINAGQTPVKALGVTDQHSQVQLYNEGPYDKVITFLEVKNFRSERKIPFGCEDYPNVNFLCGHSLNELMNKEMFATRYNLSKRGRVNYTITIDEVNEFNVGALVYLLQMQTAYAGALLNINTYNQPGVEGGKNATYALFGRKGYESLAAEISVKAKRLQKFIIEED